MQLNTDRKKTCLLKDFFLDIFQNVGFVCFRMCWRILMTLLLQLAVVEGHQELPLVTIGQDQNSSIIALNRDIDIFFIDCVGGLDNRTFVSRS